MLLDSMTRATVTPRSVVTWALRVVPCAHGTVLLALLNVAVAVPADSCTVHPGGAAVLLVVWFTNLEALRPRFCAAAKHAAGLVTAW